MADDYDRLFLAAQLLHPEAKIDGPSALARFLDLETPQMATNWKRRGVPRGRIVELSGKVGCRAEWLSSGAGQMSDVAPQNAAPEESEPAFEITDEEARWVLLMRRVLSEPRSRLIHLIEEEAERSDRIRREVLGDAGSAGDYEGAQAPAEDRRKKDRRSSVGWSYFAPEQGQGESVPAKRSAK